LAAAWIGRTIGVEGAITEEQAAQLVAEADMQDWHQLTIDEQDWYVARARDMLERISTGPRAIPMRDVAVWCAISAERHQMAS
jgi:hypothetical protein